MNRRLYATLFFIGIALLAAKLLPADKTSPSRPVPAIHPQQQAPEAVIDVAFCLDTTGSMSGLIEGAKQKIWSIVNTVATAKPKPALRIGLVAYRDRGDAYVTKVYDFTSDLESMYTQLRALQADGGGDTEEHVNKALNDAVNTLHWNQNKSSLKIVYLVGDAPPHMDYQDGYNYQRIARQAAESGIIINTVQCGDASDTRSVWQEVARMADGKFVAIDQTGGMVAMASPYDEQLAQLSAQLNKTYVAYGSNGEAMQAAQTINDGDAELRALPAAAERASTKAGSLYKNESWDLVDAVKTKSVKLDEMKPSDLPADLRGKSAADQKAYLDQKAGERSRLQKQIQELASKRDAFVQAEQKKNGMKTANAFDAQVLESLKEQGRVKGIAFE